MGLTQVSTSGIKDATVATADIADSAVSTAKIANGAVSNAKIVDSAINNAKVVSDAAIAGTKITPNFGSQNILTTGTAATGNLVISDQSPQITLTESDTTTNGRFVTSGGQVFIQAGAAGSGSSGAGILNLTGYSNVSASQVICKADTVTMTGGLTVDNGTFRVDSTNNLVGVGTSSPAENLHIRSNSNVGLRLDDSGQSYGNIIYNNGSNSTDALTIGVDEGNTQASTTMRFRVDASEKMRITSDGDLGIGSTSPTTKLHVVSPSLNTSSLDTTNCLDLGLRIFAGSANNTTGAIQSGITLGEGRAGLYAYDDGSGAANGLGFWTGSNSGVTEKVRITSLGRLGIGTTSPGSPIHVESDANNLLQLVSTDRYSTMYMVDSAGSTFIQCDSGVLRFGGGGSAGAAGGESEFMRIGSTGLVGIGTNSPQSDLHIESATPHIRLSDSDNSSAYCLFDGNGGNLNIHADKGNAIANSTIGFAVDNSVKMTINSSGKVGIGTTNPGQALEVRQTAASHAILAVNRPNSDTFCVALGNTSGNKAVISSNNTDLLFGRDFSGTFTERMRMRNDGGLTFNGDTAAANALDDYEEGTFTPTSNNDLGAAEGSYTKIGRQVTLHIRVTVDSNTNNNAMVIGGFPFTPSMPTGLSNGSTPAGFGYISGSVITGGIQIHTRYNVNECQFYTFTTNLKRSHFSGRELRFGLVYHV